MIFSLFKKNLVLGYSWSTLLWHRCYYPYRSGDALSPVCGIFFYLEFPSIKTGRMFVQCLNWHLTTSQSDSLTVSQTIGLFSSVQWSSNTSILLYSTLLMSCFIPILCLLPSDIKYLVLGGKMGREGQVHGSFIFLY